MDQWIGIIEEYSPHAHWILFGLTLLAGLNVPISIDLLMIVAAVLGATLLPTAVVKLFFFMFFGCMFSAWIAYFLGRTVGRGLVKLRFISKIFPPKRIETMRQFYEKRGHFAFLIGRFIPFGVRNGLFMSCGMSRVPFSQFALWEGLACALWSAICFSLYYFLGKNIETLYTRVKIANILIFIAFSVTVIGFIWYKRKKTKKEVNV